MTRERIVYNPHEGGVAVCIPSERCIYWMARGDRWALFPPDYWKVQVQRQIDAGHLPDAAERFARALQFGGLSRREAVETIAARDCGHLGSAIEIVDVSEIPSDRTYRNAWRRSSNGGPIVIDEQKAIEIDARRLWKAYEGQNAHT